ncbi:DUF3304 domain-containing protein [Acidovorax cavernicola]|uniref:DUF3304 domain-containing protein n=1 Tax=Acidovorax cavernicola TaxID=1675792 RepID=A0A9X8GUG4_9BURK|nr:DUF3304 domain-containing protein [Acidovorax cavernicola]RIX78339.1 DUF3304 domain-containing protein [Acidovorax cavernicola]
MKRTTILTLCALALLTLPLVACSSKERTTESYSANLSPYNHTGDHIEPYVDGIFAGHSSAYGGGGSFVCCISYPAKWRPGLSAKVRWATSSGIPGDRRPEAYVQQWHEKVVPIEKYDVPGSTLNIHFLAGGEVRLIISSKGAGAKDYPGPAYPVKPPNWKW